VNLGAVGIWTSQFDFVAAPVVRDAVVQLEELGYGAVWFGENIGREPIAQDHISPPLEQEQVDAVERPMTASDTAGFQAAYNGRRPDDDSALRPP
jgi:hypothetical protein